MHDPVIQAPVPELERDRPNELVRSTTKYYEVPYAYNSFAIASLRLHLSRAYRCLIKRRVCGHGADDHSIEGMQGAVIYYIYQMNMGGRWWDLEFMLLGLEGLMNL